MLDTHWDHEPDRPKGVTKPSRGQCPRNGVSIITSAPSGRNGVLGWGFPGRCPGLGLGKAVGLWTRITHPLGDRSWRRRRPRVPFGFACNLFRCADQEPGV